MSKVVVVGGGIAGLSAGIYALQSGFDVTILEMHTIPGGNCTSWRRKGYFFEGGLHWLTGSGDRQPLNKVWRNLGAIDDKTKVYRRDPFFVYERAGQKACLYTNPDQLKEHLLSLSPDDRKAISSLYKDIKRFAKMPMPVLDIKGVKVTEKSGLSVVAFLRMLPAMMRMPKLGKATVSNYAKRFQSHLVRGLLENVIGEDFPVSSMFFTLGALASGDGGYLEGGSLKMAKSIAERFESLGGKIEYGERVERVLVEDGRATGVLVDGDRISADAVVVTVDTHSAIDRLFEEPLDEPWTKRMRNETIPMVCTFISIGVKEDLSALPDSMTFFLAEPLMHAGKRHSTISFTHYAKHEGYAPQGCTAFTVVLMGDTYEYWVKQRESGRYWEEKDKLAEQVLVLLTKHIPQIAGKIEVVDVATPLTYERYCGTYHGSWMTAVKDDRNMRAYPAVSEKIKNLYFAGQRLQPPGGLPVAADSGRRAVQHLCRDTGQIFQSNGGEYRV